MYWLSGTRKRKRSKCYKGSKDERKTVTISALQDQHRLGEGSATHVVLTGDIERECYVDDSQLDSTPLSDLTDDDAQPAGNKMTSQLRITIPAK